MKSRTIFTIFLILLDLSSLYAFYLFFSWKLILFMMMVWVSGIGVLSIMCLLKFSRSKDSRKKP